MKKLLFLFALTASLSIAGPVSYYGALTVDGKYIKDQNKSQAVQLKGPSLHWGDGAGLGFYSSAVMDWFVDTMDIAVIRYAMPAKYDESYGGESGLRADGYLASASKAAEQKARIDEMVKAAIRNDIYIIIDWHSHRAQYEQTEAVAFFQEMATKYKDVPNVIFEIYNEPVAAWDNIKGYMEAVIQAIRNNAQNDNLILVGSPSWSSNPNEASAGGDNSLHKKYKNIAYTMHFYAVTHRVGGSQHSNSNTAMNSNNAAVFVSEWGTTAANGQGNNVDESTDWLTWMDQNEISSCNWSASNIETSSIFNVNAGLALSNLSTSGKIFFKYMGGNGTTPAKTNPPSGWPWARSVTVTLNEGATKEFSASDLQVSSGASIEKAEVVGSTGTAQATDSKITLTVPQNSQDAYFYVNFWVKQGSNSSKHRITVNINRGPKVTVTELMVSRTGVSKLTYAKLGITSPGGFKLSFDAGATVTGGGTVTKSTNNDTLTFTPPANAADGGTANLTFTVKDATGLSTNKTITLTYGNVAPVAWAATANISNTVPSYTFSLDFKATPPVGDKFLPAYDDDEDYLTVEAAQLNGWPGTVEISEDKRSIIYTPPAGQKSGGRPVISYIVTDGTNVSNVSTLTFTISGTGTDIVQGESTEPPLPVLGAKLMGNFGLKMLGKNLSVELSKSGIASLDIYSISGKRAASLMNGNQSAGLYEFNLGNLQKGVYIIRLKQGSELKVQRVVVR